VSPGTTKPPQLLHHRGIPAPLLFSPADVLILLMPSAELHPTEGQEFALQLHLSFEGSSDIHPPRGLLMRACSLVRGKYSSEASTRAVPDNAATGGL